MARTIIYVDGYNLYYSRLKSGPYKWLDIVQLLFHRILSAQDPTAQLVGFRYFTAPIKARYARHGTRSEHAQTQYLRALTATYPMVDVIQGFHVLEPSLLPTFVEGAPPQKDLRSKVWLIEEKQTDVNLALHLYRDVRLGKCDQVVICSNDSDVEPALSLLRQDFPGIRIGLILPLHESEPGRARISNKRLIEKADWTRHHIRDEELAASQFSDIVPTRKKPAIKPAHW